MRLANSRLVKFIRSRYGGARPSVVYRELVYRLLGAPDKIPIPPRR